MLLDIWAAAYYHSAVNVIQEMFPYLIVRNASAAIAFYKQVFGA